MRNVSIGLLALACGCVTATNSDAPDPGAASDEDSAVAGADAAVADASGKPVPPADSAVPPADAVPTTERDGSAVRQEDVLPPSPDTQPDTAPLPPLAGAPGAQLGLGFEHSCLLKTDGTVWCWGVNNKAQLGDGTTSPYRAVAMRVPGVDDAVQIDAGSEPTCALRRNHTIVCWGGNSVGQLGDGTKTGRSHPVQVMGIDSATQVSAGFSHTCALLAGGTVKCWGSNSNFALGDGTTTLRTTPVVVKGLTDVVQVSAGVANGCALLKQKTIFCWGYNAVGQLGNGAARDSGVPVAVKGINNGVQVAAGDFHSCALLADGTAMCWGLNTWGQVGDGTFTGPRLLPVAVVGAINGAFINGGHRYSSLLKKDGTVLSWGYDYNGEAGYGHAGLLSKPTMAKLTGVATLAAGGYHACAVLAGGAVKCWGNDQYGQVGDGTTANTRLLPTDVKGL